MRSIEPPVAYDILDDGLDGAVAEAHLTVDYDRPFAHGRARVLHLSRGRSSD